MKRSIALISAAATTFSLIVLASVVYGYRVGAKMPSAPSAPSAAQEPQPAAEVVAEAPVPIPRLSPEAAAAAAAQFLDRADPYSVELADYNGVQAYKVTFPSGEVVYISPRGEVLASVAAPVQVTTSNVSTKRRVGREGGKGADKAGGGGTSGGHESEHDGGGDD